MSNINLLPWRQARAQRQKKQFGILFGLFLAGTAAIALPQTGWCSSRSVTSSSAISGCSKEMATLDTQLGEIRLLKERRKELIDRMQLIEQLQMRRNILCVCSISCRCWSPTGYILIALPAKQQDRCEGKTEAYGGAASMMRRIDGSGWLTQSQLSTIFHGRGGPIALVPVLHDVPDCHGATQRG